MRRSTRKECCYIVCSTLGKPGDFLFGSRERAKGARSQKMRGSRKRGSAADNSSPPFKGGAGGG